MAYRRILGLAVCLWVIGVVVLAQQPTVKKERAPHTPAASGKEMYRAYCASCHGAEGKGNGPAAPAMKRPPTDLTQLSRMSGGKFPAERVAETIRSGVTPAHGSKEMPVWGPVLSSVAAQGGQMELQLRIRNLTQHIESLQAK